MNGNSSSRDIRSIKADLEMIKQQLPVNFTSNNVRRLKQVFIHYQQIVESLPGDLRERVKLEDKILLIQEELEAIEDKNYPWRKAKIRFRYATAALRACIELARHTIEY